MTWLARQERRARPVSEVTVGREEVYAPSPASGSISPVASSAAASRARFRAYLAAAVREEEDRRESKNSEG